MPENKEIAVELSIGICKICGSKREIYNLSGFLYGERLLLTEDGKHYAYLNCFDDTAFNEVNTIMKDLVKGNNLTLEQETNCFNKVFGISCDNIKGSKIDSFRIKESCLSCGSDQLLVSENYPPDIIKVKLPTVTHDCWNKLDEQSKSKLILNELSIKGCI